MKWKTLVLSAVLILMSSNCFASDLFPKWSATDVAMEVVADGLLAVDWGQTLAVNKRYQHDIDTNADIRHYEDNALLGKHPSRGAVNAYFGGIIAGKLLLNMLLPSTGKKIVNGGVIGLELYVTAHNFAVGTNMRF